MNFFDQIILDNSIKDYCYVLGTIVVVLIIKKFISRYIVSLIYKAANKIWKRIEKQTLTDLVLKPLEVFLLILISVFALHRLKFPSALNFSIYQYSTHEIIVKIGIFIIIVSLLRVLLRGIDFIGIILRNKSKNKASKGGEQVIIFFKDFLKVVIAVMGVLLILQACFNQDIGNLLTGLSIVGAAVAFAAKESIENLIASFVIFFDKPFSSGDTLKVNTIIGKVEKIGLRSTRIRTLDKTLVTVPNKQMVDSIVDNWTRRTYRRAEIRLELSLKTSTEQLSNFVASVNQTLKSENLITSSGAFFKEMNKTGLLVVIEYATKHIYSSEEFEAYKETIMMKIKNILDAAEISIATS